MIKKIARLILLLLGASFLLFFLAQFIEGNPAQIALQQAGIDPTPAEIARMEEILGLDGGMFTRYVQWLGSALRFDWGLSYVSGQPVGQEIARRLPQTLSLGLAAFVLMLFLALPLGVFSAYRPGGKLDKFICAVTLPLMGVPSFALGIVLLYFFALRWGVLPMVGSLSIQRHILPAFALALPMAARYVRLVRGSLLAVLEEDYILQLRAYGVGEGKILFPYALKQVSIPLVSLLGMSFGTLIGGSIIVEMIFSWPGLGGYLMTSIERRDFPVILAYIQLMGASFLIIHCLVDLVAGILDPRISRTKGGAV